MKEYKLSLSKIKVLEDLNDLVSRIEESIGDRKAFYILDDMMSQHYEKLALEIVQSEKVSGIFNVDACEENKNLSTVDDIVVMMNKAGINRNDVVVAIGGGLTTDLAGFVASIYQRGIECIFVPTTLLSMVDAVYGGKVGVNASTGKNQIGSFHSATEIFLLEEFLHTLSEEQYASGLGEIVKYSLLTNDFGKDMMRNGKVFQEERMDFALVIEALLTKELYVRSDVKDMGIRQMLNLGHTIGHALEHTYRLPHGIAVLHGIYLELKLLDALGYEVKEKQELLSQIVPEEMFVDLDEYDVHTYGHFLMTDKKNTDQGIGVVCLEGNKQKIVHLSLEVFYELLG